MRKLAISLAAIGLVASPIAAQSDLDPVVGEDRVSAAPIIVFALAALAIGIAAGGDDDEPISA